MEFSDVVKTVREKTGLSQEDLAHVLGVSFVTINRWENGKTKPNKMAMNVFYEYCKKIGISEKTILS